MIQLETMVAYMESALFGWGNPPSQTERQSIRRIAEILITGKQDSETASRISRILARENIGTRWNWILDSKRADHIAEKLDRLCGRPCCRALDLFSGTETIANALRKKNWHVTTVEHRSFPKKHFNTKDHYDYESCLDNSRCLTDLMFDVVLIVASLHHTPRIDSVLGWVSKLNTSQIIIIENLRCEGFSAEVHKVFDWFFNHCLNDFHAPCPGWYWTREQWGVTLSTLGSCQWLFQDPKVPGIPFPYDWFSITPKMSTHFKKTG